MRFLIVILLYFYSCAGFSLNQDIITETELPFKPGEQLVYSMHYGFINGGSAGLYVREAVINGKKVFHAKALAKTEGLTDRLYKVRDVYESYFDPNTGLPIKSIRNIREADYRKYNEVRYYHDSNMVHSKLKGEKVVPDNIFDMLSGFYFARKELFTDLKKEQIVEINTYFDDEVYPLKIRYKGCEVIETEFGEISCLKFMPVVEPGRVFDTEDDLEIWISDDKNKIPVRVQLNLFIGSAKCELISYSGLAHKFGK